MINIKIESFSDWRNKARHLLGNEIEPSTIIWSDTETEQFSLFDESTDFKMDEEQIQQFLIPKQFLSLAKIISHYRDINKWHKLYQLLWRLTHGERNLLAITSDPLIHELMLMQKAIRREAHKMKAFVRFCKFEEEDGTEQYLAWYKPEHLVLRIVAPFFQRRFAVMRWTVITPDETVHWDGEKLHYSEGKLVTTNPTDELEHLWQTYYRAIFNPARIKIKAMKKEMPTRYWHNLPETQMIPSLLAEAPQRLAEMMSHQEGFKNSAADFLPNERHSLSELKMAAKTCQGCPLHHEATQTVFGSGNPQAKLVLVGEQPGDLEDRQGKPFVGPAGKILTNVLHTLGIELEEIYITNAVKHFKFFKKLDQRMHRSPDIREINACKPWVLAELELIKPQVVLCLGLSAAKSLINPAFRIKQERGEFRANENYLIGATFHPSAVLRAANDAVQEQIIEDLRRDIERAYCLATGKSSSS